jgi:hypothetical protein
MPMDRDTTVSSYVLDATGDQSTWTLTFPGRDPLPLRVISSSADSIVTETGPFPGTVRKRATVNLVHSTFTFTDANTISGIAIVDSAPP